MSPTVFCALLLASSMVAVECVGRDERAHIETPHYPEAPTLTYFVNSTATATSYRTFFDDFDPFI